jgi:hypothetical protein
MGIEGQRKTTSARGEQVDFDLLLIKQQLAAAPKNIEVARRQEFIDDREQGKSARKKPAVVAPVVEENQPLPAAPVLATKASASEFENENGDIPADVKKVDVTPVPVIERPAKK